MMGFVVQPTIFYQIAFLVTIFTGAIFALIILLRAERTKFNILFGLMNLSAMVWALGRYGLLTSRSADQAQMWLFPLYVGSIIVHVLFFHAIIVFLDREKRWRTLIKIFYANAILLLVLTIIDSARGTHFFLGPVKEAVEGLQWIDGRGKFYNLHLINEIVIPSLAFIQMLLAYRTLLDIKRAQLQLIIFSSFFGFVGGNTILLPIYGFSAPPIGVLFVPINFIVMTYAIFRYKLVPFKIIITEIFAFGLLVTLLVQTTYAQGIEDMIFRGWFLVVISIFLYSLVKSVYKEVEQRELIQKQEQELEVVNAQQEGLLHFISHEVKGYLTKNEAGFAAITEGDYGAVSEPLKTMAASALVDTRRGVETVMDILDASNLKKGTVAYDKKSFDFSSAVRDTVNALKSMAQEKGISLEYTDGTAGASTIVGDENKLRRHVIRNLIDNSIRYTPSGNVSVALAKSGSVLRMTITDTGVGISPEDMQKLFTEGGHGSDSIKVNVHSTGYGLYIAKSIVEAHGGKIWAESDGPSKGARFITELPAD